MISAKLFLKVLAKYQVLSSEDVAKLKRQLAETPKEIPAESLAKRLVKKGYLTPEMATRLLKKTQSAQRQLEERAAAEAPAKRPAADEEDEEDEDDELGLAVDPAEAEDDDDTVVEEWESAPAALEPTLVAEEPRPKAKPAEPKAKPAAPKPTPAPASAAPTPPAAPVPPPAPVAPAVPVATVEPEPIVEGDIIEGDVIEGDIVEGDVVAAAPAARPTLGGRIDAPAEEGSRLAPKRRKGIGGLLDMFRPKRNRARKENPWDSTLILAGGGALLLLVVGGGFLIWQLLRQGGDQMAEEATKLYRSGSYTKAIDQYQQFLDSYPGHDGVSLAKVRQGFAQLRQAVELTTDDVKSLAVAQEVLERIATEKAFGGEKGELNEPLRKIAERLAEQARAKTDQGLVDKARDAVKLIEKYIPSTQRPKAVLDNINASLQITEREIARDGELAKAIAAMDEAIAKGEPARAYDVRRVLLKDYPDLLDNPKLLGAVLRVSAAQRDAVRRVDEAKPSDVPEATVMDKAAVAVAQRRQTGEAPGASGHVIHAMAGGTAYGLDAATGRILWRRFVGHGENGVSLRAAPLPIGAKPGSDVLLVDAREHAVLRVKATDGTVQWRQAIGEPFDGQPVLESESRALLATSSGRLVTIDLESGNAPSFIELPQKLAASPAIDPTTGRIYQAGDHSNLYVLSRDGNCEYVRYLAHEPGTVTAPPVVFSRLLIVAENRGYRNSVLRVFALEPVKRAAAAATGDEPAAASDAGEPEVLAELQQIPIEGHVDTAPLISDTRMLVTTDSGRVVAFRLSGTNVEQPLEQIAQLKTRDESNLVRFPLLVRDQFWVADKSLSKYELQSSLGNFRPDWTTLPGSVFLQPLGSIGDTIFFVRRRLNLPGVQVGAVGMKTPELIWETNLAAPLVGEPRVGASGEVELVTALGSLMDVPADAFDGRATIDQPRAALDPSDARPAIENVVWMDDGAVVLSMPPGSEELSVFVPNRSPKRFGPIVLGDPLAAAPVALAGGVLVPGQRGQVVLIDPRTGGGMVDSRTRQRIEPFQTPLAAGREVAWRRPVVVGEEMVVLADGADKVYLLTIKDQPTRHIAAAAEATLASPIASDLAVAGDVVYLIDAEQQLQRLRLPDLKAEAPIPLGARAAWGPRLAGRHVFLATEDDKLICFDGEGQQAWDVTMVHGSLAGPPLPIDDDYLFAYAGGVVTRVEGASGKELARIDTGHPLGAGPVLFGSKVLLTGSDGTLYLSDPPSSSN